MYIKTIAIFVLILFTTCCVLFSVNYYTQNPVTKAINSFIHNIWGLWVDHRLAVQGVNISTRAQWNHSASGNVSTDV